MTPKEAYILGRAQGIELAALKATEWYGKRGDALDIARAIRELKYLPPPERRNLCDEQFE